MQKIAFGTYRVTEHNTDHIEAIKYALQHGVKLIDTSSNYMNGEAERAVALAMSQLPKKDTEQVKIISKFGYIQGSLLEEITTKKLSYEKQIAFEEHLHYCLDSVFMQESLTRSLNSLNCETIEAYLVQNPEYYLFHGLREGKSRDDILDDINEILFEVFVALEKEVQNGRIKYYGISSNSFSKKSSDLEFLPYEDIISIAHKAAEFSGAKGHHCKYFELPINLLEREGLVAASWAKENSLTVMANRALNAKVEEQMYRLAEYKAADDYYHALNVVSELCSEVGLENIANLMVQLDEKKHKYSWIGEYEQFLYVQIIPYLQEALSKIDESERYDMAQQINVFLDYYAQEVAYEIGVKTKKLLADANLLDDCHESLQKCALQFLEECDDIDYILLGMRKIVYVHEVTQINS